MASPTDSLPNDPSTLKAMLLAERTRAETALASGTDMPSPQPQPNHAS